MLSLKQNKGNKVRNMSVLFILFLQSLVFAQTTWFVSPNGNNTNGSSWATAYNSIQDAVDAASTGDDILVGYNPAATTTYTLTAEIDIENKAVRITSARDGTDNTYATAVYNSVRCVLDGNNSVRIFNITGTVGTTDNRVIRGFKMINGNAASSYGGGAIRCTGALTITNNRFAYNYGSKSGPSIGGAIAHGGTGCIITNNLFYENIATSTSTTSYTGDGGAIKGGESSVITRNIFKQNACSENQSTSLTGSHGGAIFAAANCTITNNVFDGNYTCGQDYGTGTPLDYGEVIYAYDETVTIKNNVFINHNKTGGGVYAIDKAQATPKVEALNCLFFNNSGNGSDYVTLTNCITAKDPKFENPAGNDYHLQSISPCIDVGYLSSTDIPEGGETIIDIGAYEYVKTDQIAPACDNSWAGNFNTGYAFAALAQAGNGSTITVQPHLDDPPNFPANYAHIGKYWDISSVVGDNVKIRLYYNAEAKSQFIGTRKIYHYNTTTTSWEELPTEAEVAVDASYYVETTNYYAGFSNVTVGDLDNALPVELTSFTANLLDNCVILTWQTATEVNNYGFQVERQKAEVKSNWGLLGFVEGSGNSNSPKEYSFNDMNVTSGKYFYRLKQIDTDGSFTYSKTVEVNINTPAKFELFQNYPNPIPANGGTGNPTTTIKYSIPFVISNPSEASGEKSHGLSPSGRNDIANVTLKVYDVLGREVSTLVNKVQSPGNYSVKFNANNLPSGIYFYTLRKGSFSSTRKMIFIK